MMLASPILLDISKYFNVSPEKINLIITFLMIGEVTGILALIFLNRNTYIIINAFLNNNISAKASRKSIINPICFHVRTKKL